MDRLSERKYVPLADVEARIKLSRALGCERCNYGVLKGRPGEFCGCAAGQARARVASGQSAYDAELDNVTVPTVRYVGAA